MGRWMEIKENNCLKEIVAEAMGLQTVLDLLRFSLCQSQKLQSQTTFDPLSFKGLLVLNQSGTNPLSAAGTQFITVKEQHKPESRQYWTESSGTWNMEQQELQLQLMLIGRYLFSSEIVSPDLGISCSVRILLLGRHYHSKKCPKTVCKKNQCRKRKCCWAATLLR